MITVIVEGLGQQARLDTPKAALIGPWLLELFKDLEPDARMPMNWTIRISGSEIPRKG